MSTYVSASPKDVALLTRALRTWHGDLVDAGVTVSLLAHSPVDSHGDTKGHAIKAHGYPAAGKAKINSLQNRVDGLTDATITVDGDRWPDWSDEERLALLDHEAQHFELVLTKPNRRKVKGQVVLEGGGEIVLDDANRPRLKMRPHDFELGVFDAVARRHEGRSFDAQALAEAAKIYRQLELPFEERAAV